MKLSAMKLSALERSRLALIDESIDAHAWSRLLGLRVFGFRDDQSFGLMPDAFQGVPPEALAEFPGEWVAAARSGRFSRPRLSNETQATSDRRGATGAAAT